jgi:hypothetical protein
MWLWHTFMLLGRDFLGIFHFVKLEIIACVQSYLSGGIVLKLRTFSWTCFGQVAVHVHNYIYNIMRNFQLEKA